MIKFELLVLFIDNYLYFHNFSIVELFFSDIFKIFIKFLVLEDIALTIKSFIQRNYCHGCC